MPERAAQAWRMSEDEVVHALRSGDRAEDLRSYFGPGAWRGLTALARAADRRSAGARVLILPGIMGSSLGRPGRFAEDVIWCDPFDIARGRLAELALPAGSPGIRAVGVLLLAYLKLKLRLRAEGFNADFHPFDWRQGIPALGRELAERLRRESQPVHLVAHSMGGLVARAALKAGGGITGRGRAGKVVRLIMLGTPNYGSFAVPQALRGTYPIVRKIAVLDLKHSPEELAGSVFSTFPGLYQMMPWPEKFDSVDLYDIDAWPQQGPRPRPRLLRAIERSRSALAGPDERYALIAGINRETVTGMRVEGGEFTYQSTTDGDGTVPLAFARLPGVPTWYVEASHGSLPNDGEVEEAVTALLAGSAPSLPSTWSPSRGAARRSFGETQARVHPYAGRGDLTEPEMRRLIEELAAPPPAPVARPGIAAPGAAGFLAAGGPASRALPDRPRRRRLEIYVVRGSIADVDARATVLGIFQGVTPSGAAASVDERLEGALTEFTERRMFSGTVGETFLLPVGRSPLRSDMVLLAGMGAFDNFTPEVLQVVAENVMRVFIRTRVEEFCTVLLGGGTGGTIEPHAGAPAGSAARLHSARRPHQGDPSGGAGEDPITAAVGDMIAGFLRALRDTDGGRRTRRIIFCELDPGRYAVMKRALDALARPGLFRGIELEVEELPPPPAVQAAALPGVVARPREPAYLLVRQTSNGHSSPGETCFQTAVLTAGGAAAIENDEKTVSLDRIRALVDRFEHGKVRYPDLAPEGRRLARLVLPDRLAATLLSVKDRHLVVVHDAPSASVPWELLNIQGWSPALEAGMTRRYLAGESVARWLEMRRRDPALRVLLVIDPTGTLAQAKVEGQRVRRILSAEPSVRIEEVPRAEATKENLLRKFGSGEYDVIHFAGHAFFDPRVPGRSGIECFDSRILTGADLVRIGNLPGLVFFNACEAARIGAGAAEEGGGNGVSSGLLRTVSFAEAFLRGGVANYLGTYWPVSDVSAELFATSFYKALVAGRNISDSLGEGRCALASAREVDWADYVFYGSPEFMVKQAAR